MIHGGFTRASVLPNGWSETRLSDRDWGTEAGSVLDGCRTTDLVVGERKLREYLPEIRRLRMRCGQQELTTDPQYFIAANTMKGRRVAAVLIRSLQELEACVLLYEHCKFGIGLGMVRLGDFVGESLVAGAEEFRTQYLHLAAQALLKNWSIHGVSITVKAPLEECLEVMGPMSKYRMFSPRSVQYRLPLADTYQALLAGMGRHTRRSLAGKRRQLEQRMHVVFKPSLEPVEALEAMSSLQPRSLPSRDTRFFHARQSLQLENPDFFCMGMHTPEGTWLSILSGWRQNRVTYVDLQMNDLHRKKESLSAVMRAFMLEHEIAGKQTFVHFVAGCSMLLRRYCRPIEQCTDIFLSRPCFRATLFKTLTPRIKSRSVYERVKAAPYRSLATK
jgi:hypothetical protein